MIKFVLNQSKPLLFRELINKQRTKLAVHHDLCRTY